MTNEQCSIEILTEALMECAAFFSHRHERVMFGKIAVALAKAGRLEMPPQPVRNPSHRVRQ